MTTDDGLLMRTPAYQPLESPAHYILRLSEANGYSSPAVVMELAAPHEEWRAATTWDYAHLNSILPESRHTPPTFTCQWSASGRSCDRALLGRPILSRHMSALHAGICPQCVDELGFAPAWWNLHYSIACPKHRRMFVLRCSGCGKQISLMRRGLLICACGAKLSQTTDEQPSVALLWLMELLKYQVESPPSETLCDAEAPRPQRPEETSLAALCAVIETIARAERRMTVNSAHQSAGLQRRILSSVASFLYGWPHGVPAFCSRWLAHKRVEKGREDIDLRDGFAWAFVSLYRNRCEDRRNTLFVMEAVLQYVATALPGRTINLKARDLRQLPQEQRAYCGLAKAAQLSGIPIHTIIRLVRRKRIPYRVSYRGTRPLYEIETSVARRLQLPYEPALPFRQASRYLGVTHSLFRDLRRSGVLPKRHETMMPGATATCDLDAFKQQVFSQAKKRADVVELRSLDRLRLSKCPRRAMIEILKGILRGTVQTHYARDVPLRICDLLVRLDQVNPIIERLMSERPATQLELRKRYDLGTTEMSALVRYLSGTTNSVAKASVGALDEASLGAFMHRYAGFTAYARVQKMGYRAALSRVRRGGTQLLQIHAAGRRRGFVYFILRQTCSLVRDANEVP